MFNKKFEPLLMTFFMSLFISAIMSFAITLMNLGFVDGFIKFWLNAYWKAFLIAVPVVLLTMPVIKKIVGSLIKE